METDAPNQARCDNEHQRLPNQGEGFLSSPDSSSIGSIRRALDGRHEASVSVACDGGHHSLRV